MAHSAGKQKLPPSPMTCPNLSTHMIEIENLHKLSSDIHTHAASIKMNKYNFRNVFKLLGDRIVVCTLVTPALRRLRQKSHF